MSAAKGSERWLWAAAVALLVLGLLSVGAAAAGYFLWWKPRQERASAAAEAPAAAPAEPTPTAEGDALPPASETAAPEASVEPPATEAPADPATQPPAAPAKPPPARRRPAAAPAPTQSPERSAPPAGDLRGALTLEIEAVQDHQAADAVDAMQFEVRLDDHVVGTVEVRFGARGVARQNGSGRVELSQLPLGDHALAVAGGPARGGSVRGDSRIGLEAGARLRLKVRVRYMSETDRELRFR